VGGGAGGGGGGGGGGGAPSRDPVASNLTSRNFLHFYTQKIVFREVCDWKASRRRAFSRCYAF